MKKYPNYNDDINNVLSIIYLPYAEKNKDYWKVYLEDILLNYFKCTYEDENKEIEVCKNSEFSSIEKINENIFFYKLYDSNGNHEKNILFYYKKEMSYAFYHRLNNLFKSRYHSLNNIIEPEIKVPTDVYYLNTVIGQDDEIQNDNLKLIPADTIFKSLLSFDRKYSILISEIRLYLQRINKFYFLKNSYQANYKILKEPKIL